jgi:thioredoxin 1
MPLRDRLNRFAGGTVVELQEKTFDGFVHGSRLAFVDFWASWCRPCRAMAPVIRSLSREYTDIAFGKVNTETERALAERFAVRSIPTYLLYRNGKIVERFPGVATRDRLARKIEKWR